jgi:hypothetical protein
MFHRKFMQWYNYEPPHIVYFNPNSTLQQCDKCCALAHSREPVQRQIYMHILSISPKISMVNYG